MAYYTSDDYFYCNNITDKPKRHNIGSTLNQRHSMYITSPLNIMGEIFEYLPNLFIKLMFKNG